MLSPKSQSAFYPTVVFLISGHKPFSLYREKNTQLTRGYTPFVLSLRENSPFNGSYTTKIIKRRAIITRVETRVLISPSPLLRRYKRGNIFSCSSQGGRLYHSPIKCQPFGIRLEFVQKGCFLLFSHRMGVTALFRQGSHFPGCRTTN